MNVFFIHVGKCGGSTIKKYFKLAEISHMERPQESKLRNSDFIILGIRHPVDRFLSAFNYAYSVINYDTTGLDPDNLSLANVPAPMHIKSKMMRGYAYNQRYNELMNYFGTANNLAESLSHPNDEARDMAIELMHDPTEHIHKSIGFYTDNGRLVAEYADKILLYSVENMAVDIQKIASRLGVRAPDQIATVREGILKKKKLSELAVRNLKKHYQDTDYRTIDVLFEYKLIDEDQYRVYHK